jgi:adenylate cyclase
MALEIERKFLVHIDMLPSDIPEIDIQQGYLLTSHQKTIRVRIGGEKAWITIKGPDINGVRPEFEYPIPREDASYMFHNFCIGGKIEKIRRKIDFSGKTWEVDEFLGENKGLWIAEIELVQRDEIVDLPPWIRKEVTGDHRFHNSYLSNHPYSTWNIEDQND